MAYQAIDITAPGDTAPEGGAKINANFVELYATTDTLDETTPKLDEENTLTKKLTITRESFAITAISANPSGLANTTVITAPGHDFTAGELINICGVNADNDDASTAGNWVALNSVPGMTVSATGLVPGTSFRIAAACTTTAQNVGGTGGAAEIGSPYVARNDSPGLEITSNGDIYGSPYGTFALRVADPDANDLSTGFMMESTDRYGNITPCWAMSTQGEFGIGPALGLFSDGSGLGRGDRYFFSSYGLSWFNTANARKLTIGSGAAGDGATSATVIGYVQTYNTSTGTLQVGASGGPNLVGSITLISTGGSSEAVLSWLQSTATGVTVGPGFQVKSGATIAFGSECFYADFTACRIQGALSLIGTVGAQALSSGASPVAVTLTTTVTKLTTTGASQALTLADGVDGQIKTIIHVVDDGSAILTPTTKTGYTNVTFTNAADIVSLQFFTTIGWVVVSSRGVTIA